MSDDLNLYQENYEDVFQGWAQVHREPTWDHPVDIAAERDELAKLSATIKFLENGERGPNRNKDLALMRRFRELTCWRMFPINSLPDDLILQIFRQGTFCSPDNKYAPTMPMVYSTICKHWRVLALDASWLWSFLGFADERPYTLTRLFLARSKSAPLIIEIDISDRKFDYEDDTYWPTAQSMIERLAMLLPHIHRWRAFYCCADSWAPLHGALSTLQPLMAPILKQIEFKQTFDELPAETIPRSPIILLGGGAPALQELVLHTVPIDWQHLSFSNLTELELHRLSPNVMPTLQDFWRMLHQSPNLRKLVLAGAGPYWDPDAARMLPTIELLSLEELEVVGTREGLYTLEYAVCIMSMFLPGSNLHTLDFGVFPKDSDLSRVLPVLSSHFPNVQRLVLTDLHFDVTTAAHWLHAMPHVKYLSLAGGHTESSVIEALMTPARRFSLTSIGDVLCPSLATLALYDAQAAKIHDFVRTRCESGYPISTLVFDINSKDDTAALDDLREVVQFEYEGDLYDSEDEWIGPDPSDWPMDEGEE